MTVLRNSLIAAITLLLLPTCSSENRDDIATRPIPAPPNYIPSEGYVGNKDIALEIGEVIWLYAVGTEGRRPFAELKKGVWNISFEEKPFLLIEKKSAKLQLASGLPLSLNGEVAISIAEIVLAAIYGRKDRYLRVHKEGDRWTVIERLPRVSGARGGTALLKLRSNNGGILKITHGK